MPKALTASDKLALIRLASSLPLGSKERRVILAELAKTPAGAKKLYEEYLSTLKDPSNTKMRSQDFYEPKAKGDGEKSEKAKSKGEKGQEKTDKRREEKEKDERAHKQWALDDVKKVIQKGPKSVEKVVHEIMESLGVKPEEGVDKALAEAEGQGWMGEKYEFARALLSKHKKNQSKKASSDRKTLIRLASSLPVGSPERKAILAGLSKTAASLKSVEAELAKAVEEVGLGPKDQMGLKGRTMWLADGKGEILIYETNDRGVVLNHKGKEYKSVKDLMRSL